MHFLQPDILCDGILGSLNVISISYLPLFRPNGELKHRKETNEFQSVNFIADEANSGVLCSLLPRLTGQFGLDLLGGCTYPRWLLHRALMYRKKKSKSPLQRKRPEELH